MNLGIKPKISWFTNGMILLPIVLNQAFMVTIEDFRVASFEKKCDLVIVNSNYITCRILGDAKVYLYHTGEFFIEVYYSSKYKKVLLINAFDNQEGLEPYVVNVSLTGLRL